MKACVLLAMLLPHCLIHSSAKIINGYSVEITSARASLRQLAGLPHDKNVIARLERVKAFILYYELTEQLLQHFKEIAPDLYFRIDTIKDFRERSVDVYLRFVPATEMEPGAKATTNLNQAIDDKHAYISTYGHLTVSVKILTAANSLLMLAHELGHVHYQVPNLAEYIAFFNRNYTNYHMRADYLGHKPNDPSGRNAIAFENAFREAKARFVTENKRKPEHPLIVRDRILKAMM